MSATFLENVAKLEGQLVAKNPTAMDLDAGKGVKIRDIFNGLRALGEGKFTRLSDMQEKHNFQAQNVVYSSLVVLLNNMGTPVTSVTVGKKKKLDGTQLMVDFLKEQGIELPQKKASTVVDDTTASDSDSSVS